MDQKAATTLERLLQAMAEQGKTKEALAEEAGISLKIMSEFTSGKREMETHVIARLAKALDVSDFWLMGYDVPMEKTQQERDNELLAKLTLQIHENRELLGFIALMVKVPPEHRESVRQEALKYVKEENSL